ncbi:MAG: hypothetical protein KC613_05495, partial [Myxococcales bacterium]|nr:hypothetical protein [Myxococcales bacterium]
IQPGASTFRVDYVFTFREGGRVWTFHDPAEEGVFSEAQWREAGRQAGLALTLLDWDHSELEPGSYKGLLFRPFGD